MAWTTAQLAEVESAIIAIAAGAVEVQIGDKRYRKPNLESLKRLRDEMKAEIQAYADGGVSKIAFVDKRLI